MFLLEVQVNLKPLITLHGLAAFKIRIMNTKQALSISKK